MTSKQVKIQLKSKLAELARLQDEIKSLQEQADELKEELKESLEIGEYEFRLDGQKYFVSLDTGYNVTLDKIRLQADFGKDVIAKYTKSTSYTKLTIKHSA